MQSRSHSTVVNATLLILLSVLPCKANGANAPWTFVVMGDTRDKTTSTMTGVSPDLPRMAEAIAEEHPDFVIHTGDLTNGYFTTPGSPVHEKFKEMLRNWKAAVRSLYDYENKRGIPIYVVRGNHEDGKYLTDPELKKTYEEEFARFMPQNGPEHEKGLTYSFTHKGAKFFALDGYCVKEAKLIRGFVNQQWLNGGFAHDRRPFVFVFSHTPAYRIGDFQESPFPNLYSHPKQRDILWSSMKKAGVIAYFCGHVHLYCRGTVDSIEQVVVGNGGADTVDYLQGKVDPALRMHYPTANTDASGIEPGYLVVQVDESAGKVTGMQKLWNEKTRKWVTGDVFTIDRQDLERVDSQLSTP